MQQDKTGLAWGQATLVVAAIAAALGCGGWDHRDTPIEGTQKPEAVLQAKVEAQQRARAGPSDKIILFGDLHVHTTYSQDAFLMALPLVGGEGAHPPSDACDFARYCANLDFYALTDHAESLLPDEWDASKESVRQCNALAGDPESPDLVAYLGFEWTQAGLTPETHYGHRCVIFPETAEDQLPARPISSGKNPMITTLRDTMRWIRWLQPCDWRTYSAYANYLDALVGRAVCAEGIDTRALPNDCEEIASTPKVLNQKLDQWGFEALTIPHGTAWGIYTPATASIANQLDPDQFDPRRQPVIEIMSGHGNSEEYRSWREYEITPDGGRSCPEPTADYLPCCWQAGEIMRSRCGDLPEDVCQERVADARRFGTQAYTRPQQVFPDAEFEEWLDCGQCRDCFKPAYGLRPKQTVQYAMALSRPETEEKDGKPLRFRYGFVASSDGHTARPGTGYKQIEPTMMTDVVGTPGFIFDQLGRLGRRMEDPKRPMQPDLRPINMSGNDNRVVSFMFPGGLAAVHAQGRSRNAIWEALHRREVYGTSGPRILLWFDLLNAPGKPAPMGSEQVLGEAPRFEVRAVGSFEQLPGCPAWSREGLPPERLRRLCREECYHPGETRRRIASIEVIRIRPQMSPTESVNGLIEDPWRTFDCPPEPSGCVVRFEDPDFPASGRDALYYVRALEEPSMAISGSPLDTRFDASGKPVSIHICLGAGSEEGCLAPVQERAWSSPIFVNQPG
jgi:hypothetical protein